MLKLVRRIALAVILGSVVAGVTAAGSSVRAETPVSAYAALPAISSVTLSDDGAELAYIRREGESAQVIVQTRSGELVVSVDVSDRRPNGIFWVSPDHVAIESLVLDSYFSITETHFPQLDLVNVRTHEVVRVLRAADQPVINAVFDSWRGTYRGEPALYVQAVTGEHNVYTSDVYRIDLDSGRGRRIATGQDDTRGYLVRNDGEVAARIAYSATSGRFRLTTPNGSGGWQTVFEQTSLLDGPGIWGFAQDPGRVLVSTTEGVDSYLTEISLSTGEAGERRLLPASASGPLYDRDQRLVGIGTIDEDMDYAFFEPRLEAAWQVLSRGLAGRRVRLASFNNDYSVVVVRTEGDTDAGTYYVYDANARSVSVVGRAYPSVAAEDIAPVSEIAYTAADGMELTGYLTLPRGRPVRDLPLILLPHGGPAARDYARFDWWAQALASRGYAVFQPQFRGSDGFGEAYLQAGYGEWGRKMQTDLTDAVAHLAERDLIDPARVCIVGASYGGYAALAGVTMQPDSYRCAVSVAGVSDLREMLRAEAVASGNQRDSRNPVIRYWSRFMGAEGSRDRTLDERSPTRLVRAIQAPVLLIHGRDDTVVPYQQSVLMERAMREAGKSVELVPLQDEDHWLSFPATRRQMLEASIAFLEEHNPPR